MMMRKNRPSKRKGNRPNRVRTRMNWKSQKRKLKSKLKNSSTIRMMRKRMSKMRLETKSLKSLSLRKRTRM